MSDNAICREDELISEFVNLAIKRFKWENLPIGLTSDRLEEMLINHGLLGGFINEDGLLTILPAFGTSKVNIYNEEVKYRMCGFNGYEVEKDISEMCKLKNNPLATDDITNLTIFAKRINDIERTQDVNLFQMNIPKIILTNKDGILTVKNFIKQIKQFKMVVFAKDKTLTQQLKQDDVLDTSAPFLLDKLSDYENFYRNKVLTFLGINNANVDKKERLVTDEVNANNDIIKQMIDIMFECREQFCKEVKEKFNIDIRVSRRNDNEPIYIDDKTNS